VFLTAVGCLVLCTATVAQELRHSQPHGLSIPAGPLGDGLNELAQQSGLQILFSSSLVERLTGPEVKGSLTAEEALGRLLANTALRFEFVNPHTITIVRAGAEAGPSADESDPGAKSQPESNKPSNDLGNNLDPNGENKMTHRTFWARLTGFLHEDNTSHRLTASALFASLLAAGPVVAQESSTDELETVTVSASRISIAGYDQPTPVTVLGAEQLATEAKADIADAIRELPAFGGSSSPNNQVNSSLIVSGVQGLDLVDLRNLGVNRTLVLFDGQRVVSSNIRGGVDLSTLPSSLVERVDVVTGGASAAWGSDAVAGVVNLILNKKFEGLQVNFEDGDNWQGGHPTRKVEISFGTDFDDGRGHLILSGSYLDSPDAYFGNQMEGFDAQKLINNPACPGGVCGPGQPQLVHANNVGLYGYSQGGVIVGGPPGFTNIQFIGNGQPVPYNVSDVSGGLYALGADSSHNDLNPLAIPLQTYTAFSYGSFNLTDDIKASVQLNYGQSQSLNDTYADYTQNTIQPTNAYWQQILAANPGLAAQYAAAGSPAFTLGTLNTNNLNGGAVNSFQELAGTLGGTVSSNHRQLERAVFSLDGKFGQDWSWDTYWQHGESRADIQLLNNAENSLYNNATNAVYVTKANVGTSGLPIGTIACASPSGVLIPACSPLDVFGNGVASPQAIAYIQGPARSGQDAQTSVLQENVLSASMQGELPFGLAAGRVATAFGVSYRTEDGDQIATPLAAQRPTNFPYGNFSDFNGKYHVEEGFVEVNAPLLKDKLVNSLNVDAAVRVIDYSTSGTVETWKFGLTSHMTDDVSFRAAYSRDIRAPDLQELFSGGTLIAGGNPVSPKTGLPTPVFDLSGGGNLKLQPEQGTTTTAGFILTPHWINNLAISLDWYQIIIEKAIDTFNANQILSQCIAGNAVFCSSLVYAGPGGALSQINEGFLNADADSTSGLDFSVDYRTPFMAGTLLLHGAANYTFEETFEALGTSTDFANSLGFDSDWPDFAEGVPKFRGVAGATYVQGPWSGTLQGRFVGAAKLNNAWVQGVSVDDNDVPFVAYLDARLTYKLPHFDVYGAIDNVTNVEPPILPLSPFTGDPSFTTPVRDDVYDAFGRVYRLGVRARF
jgi:iron complex outermembrane recepter protein